MDNDGRTCLSLARAALRACGGDTNASGQALALVELLMAQGSPDQSSTNIRQTSIPPLDKLPASVI